MHDLVRKEVLLKGILPVKELEIDGLDTVIHANHDLNYDFTVQKIEKKLVLIGNLSIELDCQCVKCLKSFTYKINLPQWSLTLDLEGDDRVNIINDFIDLTPYIREDILLSFPLHPVCEPGCKGLPGVISGEDEATKSRTEPLNSVWSALDKLKFE
ncbi:MAG: YceD family protein [Verrucomicrobiae bacterium]|nr:YceD family protein [Verrucomicrobiae bacterium]